MKCEHYEELFMGKLQNSLTGAQLAELDQHLKACPACRTELAALTTVWQHMAVIEAPEPPANMEADFNAMLNNFKQKEAVKNASAGLFDRLKQLWNKPTAWPVSYQFALILISFFCGYLVFWQGKGGEQDKQLSQLATEVNELKQTMMLAMLENPSASERIKAVSYTEELKTADQQVIAALLTTLNNDPNVNVRLTTLEALAKLANHPEVREGLIRSVSQQESPLMQSAIADVMLKLQEKRAVKPLKKLLKDPELNEGVREKVTETINSLI
ncbi:HEAT repeat domain-containing protein [Mucilaginibacter auburnensis]|uniref:Putative zinc finger protein n=1 Tax=Mucilaginibacter auburnensis TaxID=1457233 RepID=A0A2H9VTQ3_9SPHI|nr:HEAT repeat domain-containing protein [Mucilaginibacter auburnensis]PJJ84200.1 putative zinc finger protein [Mucilaginibacter auburnensis]